MEDAAYQARQFLTKQLYANERLIARCPTVIGLRRNPAGQVLLTNKRMVLFKTVTTSQFEQHPIQSINGFEFSCRRMLDWFLIDLAGETLRFTTTLALNSSQIMAGLEMVLGFNQTGEWIGKQEQERLERLVMMRQGGVLKLHEYDQEKAFIISRFAVA